MMDTRWIRFASLVALVVAVGVGCRTKRTPNWGGGGPDILPPGTSVGGTGEIPLPVRTEDGIRVTDVQFENVLFAFDSYKIEPSEVGKIEKVADYMRRNPGVRLVTEGHCDERGSNEYNLSLGEHRALAVRAHLVSLGIEPQRIATRSYGEERPLDPGHNEEAWRKNRRVEFALYR
ncbi:MAG: OmpA family protein [Kiritimatiellae bacterium]|nr:OmpA family protein [Kiritimatiellia bacterium]